MTRAGTKRLSDLLEEGFASFSRSQKAIARYIIDHLEETGYLSAEELARMGNTSSSTVVRFAQHLGFGGYPGLQKAARDEHRLGVGTRPVVHKHQLPFLFEEDILTRVLRTDILSLEETLAKNSLDSFNRAVDLIAEARTILVAGVHEAAVIARQAAYLFDLLSMDTSLLTDGSEASVARLLRLGKQDALLGVGFRQAHPLTLAFLKQAAAQSAGTVVITDNSLSELAGVGQVTLYADIDSTFFPQSLVGPLSLVGAVASALYGRNPDVYNRHLRRVRAHVTGSRLDE